MFVQVCFLLGGLSRFTFAQLDADIKGPPVSHEKEMKHIARKGEDIRIDCPIVGNPAPIIEWRKGEDIIDYSWIRIRTSKRSMKIRNAQEEDTGMYYCKGVNGFGNTQVRVDLIIIDPSEFPELGDGELPDISPPSFTQLTQEAKEFFLKQSGDSFKATCEAIGNPKPEIFWFKDGLPFDADGIRYKNGKSTIKLRNLMKVDSAVYTCRARNIIGAMSKNFTLNVEVPLTEQPTVVGNGNVSVLVGDTASLQCRVSSGDPPHIKWLKKENAGTPSDMFTITVGDDKYRVIHTGGDIPVGVGEYLNKLVITNAQESDSGLYICFITNSGGSFNYKPSYLRVYPASKEPLPPMAGESTHILALVLCLGITVLLILVFIIVCVVRKSSKAEIPDSPDVVRTLMPVSRSTESNATITTVTSNKFDHPLPPPPSMMWGQSTMKSNLYIGASREFVSLHENSSTNLLSDRDSPVSGGNQYEVPYCYSVRTLDSQLKHAVTPASDRYPFKQYPYFHYLSDYEAY